MNLYIFEDGRIVTGGDPLNIDLAGLVVCVTNPQEGEVLTYNGSMWVNAALPEPEETEPADTEPADTEPEDGGDDT